MEPTPRVTAVMTYPDNVIKSDPRAEAKAISMKHTALQPQAIHKDFTIGRNHTVGQQNNNLYKL